MPDSPICESYKWMGQSFKYCDDCGNPFWEHSHYDTSRESHPFRTFRRIISRTHAERVKARWDR
jgi:uncharacterized protein with PIN domain